MIEAGAEIEKSPELGGVTNTVTLRERFRVPDDVGSVTVYEPVVELRKLTVKESPEVNELTEGETVGPVGETDTVPMFTVCGPPLRVVELNVMLTELPATTLTEDTAGTTE